jgi:hypothetical protein
VLLPARRRQAAGAQRQHHALHCARHHRFRKEQCESIWYEPNISVHVHAFGPQWRTALLRRPAAASRPEARLSGTDAPHAALPPLRSPICRRWRAASPAIRAHNVRGCISVARVERCAGAQRAREKTTKSSAAGAGAPVRCGCACNASCNHTRLVVQQLLVRFGRIFEVGALHDSVHGARLLAEAAVDAFRHVNVVARRASAAVLALLRLNCNGLRGAHLPRRNRVKRCGHKPLCTRRTRGPRGHATCAPLRRACKRCSAPRRSGSGAAGARRGSAG